MKQNDNTLRSQTLTLTMKALDIISKALDILSADEAPETSGEAAVQPVPPAPAPPVQPAPPVPPAQSVPPASPVQPAPAQPAQPVPPAPPLKPVQPDLQSTRSDTIRFNEQYLRDHYDLRYNTMKKTTEFRPRQPAPAPASPASCGQTASPASCAQTAFPASCAQTASPTSCAQTAGHGASTASGGFAAGTPLSPWRPITDRDLNALTVEQLLAGGQSWGYGMRLCIDASRVESFDPVADSLDHLPRWDGRDHIAALAARVPTHYGDWPRLFRRWLLAMVAQARGLSQDHGNSLVPLLIGAQGTGKSTFCKMLLPRHLRQYYMDDIKMDSAEQVERVLGRMWLVNIDEYDSKTTREQAKIKRLLTERDVQVRRPRSDQYTLVRRVCSFIATTNDDRPLCDPTGSRRYLCVELSGTIDTETPLDHDQLFAQALQALHDGEPFFLTREEEAVMEQHNRRYCRQIMLADMVKAVLQPAPTASDTLLTTTDIQDLLCDGGLRPQDMPSPRQLTAALRAAGIRQGAQQGRHGWYAIPANRADTLSINNV
ncbi:MAG: hypothetical protein IJT98_02045 [Prevotella sp.]|nr:hypothetical protein [Prevotella sp.]